MKIFKLLTLFAVLSGVPALAGEVKLNEKAPSFELLNQAGAKVKLSDYAGKNLVLVFSRAYW